MWPAASQGTRQSSKTGLEELEGPHQMPMRKPRDVLVVARRDAAMTSISEGPLVPIVANSRAPRARLCVRTVHSSRVTETLYCMWRPPRASRHRTVSLRSVPIPAVFHRCRVEATQFCRRETNPEAPQGSNAREVQHGQCAVNSLSDERCDRREGGPYS